MKRITTIAATAAALLGLPAAAQAQSSDSTVDGVAGSELSLAVAAPAAMTLTHASPATSTSVVDVTSTAPSWTLSIKDSDASGSLTPGKLDEIDCVASTLASPVVSLVNPLQWSVDGGSTYTNLTGTDATVATGSLIDAKTITYRQALTSSDEIAAGECFRVTVTYTVTSP